MKQLAQRLWSGIRAHPRGFAFAASVGAAAAHWTHAWMNRHEGSPLDVIDPVLHLFRPIAKVATLAVLPGVLGRAMKGCERDIRRTGVAFAASAVVWLSLLGVLTGLRAPLTKLLNNSVTKLYPTEASATEYWSQTHLHDFVPRWHSGEIVLSEAALLLVAVALVAVLAFAAGSRKWAPFAAVLGAASLFVFGGGALRLFEADFDFFIAGTLVGSVGLDLASFFWICDGFSETASLAYLVTVVVALAIAWLHGSPSAPVVKAGPVA